LNGFRIQQIDHVESLPARLGRVALSVRAAHEPVAQFQLQLRPLGGVPRPDAPDERAPPGGGRLDFASREPLSSTSKPGARHPAEARLSTTEIARPAVVPGSSPRRAVRPVQKKEPLWNVVLLDDDDHTYDYVVEMLMELFGHPPMKAWLMACEVDAAGRVIVDTTSRERAELKRDQIHAYGADLRMEKCAGSMSAEIQPVE
jgi:ATP-dependent Clp protease adaptor protein ClpS